jgi:hypothetical protein
VTANSGGRLGTSNSYRLDLSTGQTMQGWGASSHYKLHLGFWPSVKPRALSNKGWCGVSPMPPGPFTKMMKDGAWLAYDAAWIRVLASKGNKTSDFFAYNPANDSWKALAPWLPGTEGKLPQKGSVGCADGSGHIYATKGNNTRGFWLYDAGANSWTQKKDVPLGPTNKKVKGGTDIVWAMKSGTGYAYLLKGYKNEFWRYHTDGDSWHQLPLAPVGGNAKWDKGSWLAYDGVSTIYAHKAKYHELWKYDTEKESWSPTMLLGMPKTGSAGSKKSKDGGCGTFLNSSIYALKGGNTQEFWQYTVATNSWTEKDTFPKSTSKKKAKAGADIVTAGQVLYATKGNKSNELWKYTPGAFAAVPQPEREGVQAAGAFEIQNPTLVVLPNPLATGFASLHYSLPKAGTVTLAVFDVAGRRVLAQSLFVGRAGAVGLDLRVLSAGVYLVRTATDGFTDTQKLVVQR